MRPVSQFVGVIYCCLFSSYSALPGTFELHIDTTGVINVPENSTGVLTEILCYTNAHPSSIYGTYGVTTNSVSGWYFNGVRLESGDLGITIVENFYSRLAGTIYESQLTWPPFATLNLAGNYTCRVGNDSLVVTVRIQSKCHGNVRTKTRSFTSALTNSYSSIKLI